MLKKILMKNFNAKYSDALGIIAQLEAKYQELETKDQELEAKLAGIIKNDESVQSCLHNHEEDNATNVPIVYRGYKYFNIIILSLNLSY